jgi:glyoxylase I family protein
LGEDNKRAVLLNTGDGNYMEIFAGGSAEPEPEGAFFHVAFRSNNIVAAVEAAVAAGAEITVNPKDTLLGSDPSIAVRIAFVKGTAVCGNSFGDG